MLIFRGYQHLSGDISIYLTPVRSMQVFLNAICTHTRFHIIRLVPVFTLQNGTHLLSNISRDQRDWDQVVANCASHSNYDYINKTKVIFTYGNHMCVIAATVNVIVY